MALMWTLHELLTLFMFWNLPSVHLEEQLAAANADNSQPVSAPSPPTTIQTHHYHHRHHHQLSASEPTADIASRDCTISPAMLFIPQEPVVVTPSVAVAPRGEHN